ncbi:hypothetical protein SLA2020_055420 [Shorea laevis]
MDTLIAHYRPTTLAFGATSSCAASTWINRRPITNIIFIIFAPPARFILCVSKRKESTKSFSGDRKQLVLGSRIFSAIDTVEGKIL